jgi:hypothetical protein
LPSDVPFAVTSGAISWGGERGPPDGCRTLALADPLIGDHGPPGLLGVRAAADLELVGGLGQAQIAVADRVE